jgi:hypothetical protein
MLPLILVTLPICLSWGQGSSAGSISCTLYHASDFTVPTAVVPASNRATRITATTQSTPPGLFAFPVLPAASYDLKVTKAGFETTAVGGTLVAIAQSTHERVVLPVGSVITTVDVSEPTAALNTTTIETTAGLNQETYAAVPVPNTGTAHSMVAVATLAPGVFVNKARNDNNGSSPRSTLLISGGQGYSGRSQIDGMTILSSNNCSDFLEYQPGAFSSLIGNAPSSA